MGNGVPEIGIQYLARVRHEYEETPNRLTEEECQRIGIDQTPCIILIETLGYGKDGYVSPEEQARLKETGFTQDFIKGLAGDNGAEALMNRAKWLMTYDAKENAETDYEFVDMSRADLFQKAPHPMLISGLQHPEPFVRKRAAAALLANGQEIEAAIGTLVKDIKERGYYSIGGEASRALSFAMYNSDEVKKQVVPFLIKLLGDEEEAVRFSAAMALEQIRATSVLDFTKALQDPNRFVRRGSFSFLHAGVSQTADIEMAIPPLIKALKDSDPEVRQKAANALGAIGPAAKAAIPSLIHALGDKNWALRAAAAGALGGIGPQTKEVVPSLIRVLKEDRFDEVRWSAAVALAVIGPDAKAAVLALIEALKDNSLKRNGWAPEDALARIGMVAIPKLIHALEDKDSNVRIGVAWALKDIFFLMEPHAVASNSLVQALKKALKDENFPVRLMVIDTLGYIGPEALDTLPELEAIAQNDPSESVRQAATQALANIKKR